MGKIASRSELIESVFIPFSYLCHPCSPCGVAARFNAARLDTDEHGYPRMNTDRKECFAERIDRIRVHPPFSYPCHPCSPCGVAARFNAARLDTDEHGYPRMNTDRKECFAERIDRIRV